MCIFDKTSNPTLSNSSSWRQRRPDLVLVKSPKWSYSAYRDRAYPSPPMSGSPTSPRRSTTHFTDDRSTGAFTFNAGAATSAPGSQNIHTPRTSMEGPVAVPAGFQPHQHQQQYGQYRPPYPEQQRYELQPRPMSTHPALAPQYHPSYSQTHQPGPLPLVPTSRSQVPGMATFQGPTSLGGASNPRITRTSRRAKAHVARACQNCKKAHLSCDEARPCARCVSSGKQATCIDVEHKKRGRPRLRDDRDQRLEQAAAAAVAAAVATAQQAQRPNELSQSGRMHGHRRADSLRVLRSQASGGEGVQGEAQGQMPHLVPDLRYQQHYQTLPESYRNTGPALTAFLNMDLRILKASNELRRLFADGGDLRGRPLSDFVGPQHQQALQRIQSELRDERTSREPTFLPGIFPEEQEQNAVATVDVEAANSVSQGFSERHDTYSFRLANGRTEQLQVRVRLARTSTFFATLILQRQQIQSQPTPQHTPYGRSGGYLPMPQPSPTQLGFPHNGPPSPYNNSSAPGSPFSTLHTALITTLPPSSSIATSYSYAPSQARADQGFFSSRYPATTAAGMYPPPPPSLSRPTSALPESRPNTARERHRPEPLGNLQLPPIVSSAPTTPMTSEFYHHQQVGPSSEPRRQSPLRRSPEQRPSSDDEEEESRKRRRINIKEIIER